MFKLFFTGTIAAATLAAPTQGAEKQSDVYRSETTARAERTQSAAPARREAPFGLLRISSLIGEEIQNTSGEKLGHVQELGVDVSQKRIAYAVADLGEFLGQGDKLFAVPWKAVSREEQREPVDRRMVLDADQDRLKKAQGFDRGQWPDWADPKWAKDTHALYNQKPYWDTERQSLQGEPISPQRRSKRGRYERVVVTEAPRPVILRSNEEILGHPARHASNGERLGEINELLVDRQTGQIAFVVLQLDRNSSAVRTDRHKTFVALPVAMFSWERHGDPNYPYTVECCLQRLRENRFASDNWPDLTSKRWAQGLYDSFGRQPYWDQK